MSTILLVFTLLFSFQSLVQTENVFPSQKLQTNVQLSSADNTTVLSSKALSLTKLKPGKVFKSAAKFLVVVFLLVAAIIVISIVAFFYFRNKPKKPNHGNY